jgi:hypothetical protein
VDVIAIYMHSGTNVATRYTFRDQNCGLLIFNKSKKLISIAEIHKAIFGISKIDFWDIKNRFDRNKLKNK